MKIVNTCYKVAKKFFSSTLMAFFDNFHYNIFFLGTRLNIIFPSSHAFFNKPFIHLETDLKN